MQVGLNSFVWCSLSIKLSLHYATECDLPLNVKNRRRIELSKLEIDCERNEYRGKAKTPYLQPSSPYELIRSRQKTSK